MDVHGLPVKSANGKSACDEQTQRVHRGDVDIDMSVYHVSDGRVVEERLAEIVEVEDSDEYVHPHRQEMWIPEYERQRKFSAKNGVEPVDQFEQFARTGYERPDQAE